MQFKNSINKINEGFKNKLASVALATGIGLSSASGAQNIQAAPVNEPQQQVQQIEPQQQTPKPEENKLINIDIIAKIESGGKANAVSNKGAVGLCQIMPETWKDETKKLFGHSLPLSKMTDPELNKKVSNYYYNTTLPHYLESYNVPVNYATILAAYNYGITNVTKLYRKHGNNWWKHLPEETKNYISSYKNIAGIE